MEARSTGRTCKLQAGIRPLCFGGVSQHAPLCTLLSYEVVLKHIDKWAVPCPVGIPDCISPLLYRYRVGHDLMDVICNWHRSPIFSPSPPNLRLNMTDPSPLVLEGTEASMAEVDTCTLEIERKYEVIPAVICSMCFLFGIIYCFFGKPRRPLCFVQIFGCFFHLLSSPFHLSASQ